MSITLCFQEIAFLTGAHVQNTVEHVKRKLQFVQVLRYVAVCLCDLFSGFNDEHQIKASSP